MFRRVALVSLLALSAAASAQTTPAIPELPADQAAMRAHVMFLASDHAGWITGETLGVDGGK